MHDPTSGLLNLIATRKRWAAGMVYRRWMQKYTWSMCVPVLALLLACGSGVDPAVEEKRSMTQKEESTSDFPRFSWVVADELAAMPLPGRRRPLAGDAEFLHQEGIRVLVSLTEEVPDGDIITAAGMKQVHIPVHDFTAPTIAQIEEFVSVVKDAVVRGEAVGVHCTAGLGRSGTMAAAYLVTNGASAVEAIAKIRQLRPGSIETELQEDVVKQYEIHLSMKQ